MKASILSLLLCVFLLPFVSTKTQPNAPCHDVVFIGGPSGQFAFSEDGGETWTSPSITKLSGTIFSIVQSATEFGDITIGTTSGVSNTENSGLTWKSYVMNSSVVAVVANNTKSISALSRNGYLYKSSDDGLTWPDIFAPPSTGYTALYVKGQRYYAGNNNSGLYFSSATDNFQTWTQINLRTSGSNVASIAGNGSRVYVGMDLDGGQLIVSEDDFATWAIIFVDPQNTNNGIVSIATSPDTVFAALRGVGVAVASQNAIFKWSIKNTADGLVSNNVVSLSATTNGCVYAATPEGLSISSDGGQKWITKTTLDGLPTDNITVVYAKNIDQP